MSVPASELGIPKGAEIKPFSEVSAEEIARRIGWNLQYFSDRSVWVHSRAMGAGMWIINFPPPQPDLGEESTSYLEIFGPERGGRRGLVSTVVILEEGSMTFVDPISHHSVVSGDSRYSWVTVSKEKGITSCVRLVRERDRGYEALRSIDPKIIEAAGLATRRLQESRKR